MNNNRLLIYFFYDGDGIVDEYNIVMLKDMMKNCKDLFVVSNGQLSEEGYEKFHQLTDSILERENKGFDVGAYKEALYTIGWDKLYEYDEVILMNYTIMGPVYPFEEMFAAMDAKDLDFWGITKYHMVKADPYGIIKCGYLREHIQSHFIAVRKNMLMSDAYREYWEKMPFIKSYGESVAYHESYFTHHFAKRGFKWDVYVNTDDMKKFTEYPLLKAPKTLIKEKRCPIFKRRNFNHEYLDFINTTIGEPTYELMEYLKNDTDYDVELLWENILRTCNQAKIKDCLQLNYIVSSKYAEDITDILDKRKVALVLHLYYEDLLDESYRYAASMPKESDIYITVGSERMKTLVEEKFKDIECNKCEVLLIPNRGRDVGAVLVAVNPFILEYDYVCFAHDKKVTQLKPECKGASWAYQCFESVLKNKTHVNNIIRLFEENPRMGLLTPAPPYHAEYFPTLGHEWGANFKNVKKLAKELDIHVPMSQDDPPISAIGCFFWYRPKAMKKLYDRNYSYEDFPEEPMKKTDGTILHAIERMYSFAVQDAGYYSAWCFSDNVASMEITNLYFMLRHLGMSAMSAGYSGTFIEVNNHIRKAAPVMLTLNDLHTQINGLMGTPAKEKKKVDTMMHLYFDTGMGYSQKNCESARASFQKNRFQVEFDLSEDADYELDSVVQLRFDPGESGMMVMKKLIAVLEYEDGSEQILDVNQMDSNGFAFKKKILFINEDPQIYLQCDKNKKLTNITFSGKIKREITPEIVSEAINQRVPKLTPRMYYDCGEGITENHTIRVPNNGTCNRLDVKFDLSSVAGKISSFRFDPCEEGMLVVDDLIIKEVYDDESEKILTIKNCKTNGINMAEGVFFPGLDPWITWNPMSAKKVKSVCIQADILGELSGKMLQDTLDKQENLVSYAKKMLKR